MKIALYIEDGLEQIVLTPETKTEHSLLGKLHDGSRQLKIIRASFYATNGGYMRNTVIGWTPDSHYASAEDQSTIIVLKPIPPEVPNAEVQNQG